MPASKRMLKKAGVCLQAVPPTAVYKSSLGFTPSLTCDVMRQFKIDLPVWRRGVITHYDLKSRFPENKNCTSLCFFAIYAFSSVKWLFKLLPFFSIELFVVFVLTFRNFYRLQMLIHYQFYVSHIPSLSILSFFNQCLWCHLINRSLNFKVAEHISFPIIVYL